MTYEQDRAAKEQDATEAMIRMRSTRSTGPHPDPARDGEMVMCSDCPPVGYPTDKTRCTPCPRRLAKDVIRLVVAARNVVFEPGDQEAQRELLEASEAFASRVPWERP